ncbi:E3 ubiquitin-protein ligase MARCH6 [Entomortierella parvispora]|uniref:RING-type E3 ubiquitin transferase n=1 Tax=Entomortierella parvispora TaxID=205924 RepID=A0A9P3LVP0_9FUNG|nr:E3 ubiquitin-protein ligase MARCH6 [Entomortierella parvispora]
MEESEEICRVCRSEGTTDQPLFHPCKCSGSIRFVHQECLLEWLKHSNKRYCELCKYNFSFTPIYSPEMPATIPLTVLIRRATDKVANGMLMILRAVLVATIWLMILPYFTIWIWRLYFWIGETFAFRANGLETPQWNATSFFASRHNMSELTAPPSSDTGKTVDSVPVLLAQVLAPEYQWISKFMLDCFEGQIISGVVIVVFVIVFLLREWVIQNQEHDGLRMGMNDGGVPAAAEEAEGHGFVEHAVERLIAVQHHIEAVVEGEISEDEEESQEAAERPQLGNSQTGDSGLSTTSEADVFESLYTQPGSTHMMQPQRRPSYVQDGVPPGPYEHARFFWETENAGGSGSSGGGSGSTSSSLNPTMAPFGSWPGEGGSAAGSSNGGVSSTLPFRPFNERTHSSDPTTQAFASTNTLDRSGRRPPAMESRLGRDISFTAPEDIPSLGDRSTYGTGIGYVYDPVNQTYHPERRILTRMGAPLYWKEGVPLTYRNVYLKQDGTEMTAGEKRKRFDELCMQDILSPLDIQRLRTWGINTEGVLEGAVEDRVRARRQELFRQIEERDVQRRPGEAPNPGPIAVPHARRLAAVPVAQDRDDEEELDGILEVIGMNGSFWILLQNSLLMAALICSSLGLGVWIPFMLGKTTLLMNPINIFRIPLGLLSRLTDPILDFLLDRVVPFIGDTLSKVGSAVLSKSVPIFSPVLIPILGPSWDLMAMDKLNGFYQDHVVSAWQVFMDISTSSTLNADVPTSAILEQAALGNQTANVTLVHHVARKWAELAYGNTSGDKFAAILVGYALMFAAASWYFSRVENAYGQSFAKMTRDALRQQGLILKIAFFIVIEHFVFPLVCGVAIGMSTLPVFRGSTFWTRVAFYSYTPGWFVFLHWIVGTIFVIYFSVFIGMCRTIVRPGVMWFIKNPSDEGFNPFRENLERPLTHQLKKLVKAAFMYLTLIALGFLLVTQTINFVFKGVFPLRGSMDPLSSSEIVTDVPIDLLLFHLVVPLTARWLNPTHRAKVFFKHWCRTLSRWLRLTSFLYGVDGARFPEEEGHVVHRTWKTWILGSRPPIPGAANVDGATTGSGEELDISAPVVFVQDGALYRVPNVDRRLPLKDRLIFVPVNENGDALDPNEDLLGQVDHNAELPRIIDGPRPLVDPKQGTVVVYGPPNFQRRLLAFVFVLWTSSMFFLAMSLVCPLVVGRAIFMWTGMNHIRDIHCITAGVYVLAGIWYSGNWILAKLRSRATMTAEMGEELQPRDLKSRLKAVWRVVTAGVKLAYFVLTFGIILPLALGLMVELYLILPLRSAVDGEGGMIFVVNWAVGLIYMKICHRILTAMPDNALIADLNRVFVNADVHQWDAGLATRRLILPAIMASFLVISCPLALAWAVIQYKGLEGPIRGKIMAHSYPTFLIIVLIAVGLKEMVQIIRGWGQYVRDEEYLVGRQLHNLHDENETAAAAAAATFGNTSAVETLEQGSSSTEATTSTALEHESSPRLRRLPSLEPSELHDLEEESALFGDDTEMPKHFGIRYSRNAPDGDDLTLGEGGTEESQSLFMEPEQDMIAYRTRSRRRLMAQAQEQGGSFHM